MKSPFISFHFIFLRFVLFLIDTTCGLRDTRAIRVLILFPRSFSARFFLGAILAGEKSGK